MGYSSTRKLDAAFFFEQLDIYRGRRTEFAVAVITVVFVTLMLAVNLAQAWIERLLGLNPLVLLSIVWLLWIGWQSILFERNRQRHLRRGGNAYRRMFLFNIYPGAGIAMSQMVRPLGNGAVLKQWLEDGISPFAGSNLWLVAGGILLIGCAITVFTIATNTIGFGSAAFVHEFVEVESFEINDDGIYGLGRHPMFWSGVLLSVGLSLCVQSFLSFAIAGANVFMAGVYSYLEDIRLRRVFADGGEYSSYMQQVPSWLPWPRVRRNQSASRKRSVSRTRAA